MSFATLRQTVLQKGVLAFYGESASFARRGGMSVNVTVKIAHRQSGPQSDGRRQAGPVRSNTVDELEVIEVTFSRDSTYTGGALTDKPDPGDTLQRLATRDSDRRPFVFAGEVMFEGDQHAVYVFQRPRRMVAGGTR